MQDVDLFLSLAEIDGVFVDFGALISVRSGGASDAHEVVHIRSHLGSAARPWAAAPAIPPLEASGPGRPGER
jgi:hypothetical protein